MRVAIRKATENDIASIHSLLEVYAKKQIVLSRSKEDILYHLKNFTIAVDEFEQVQGCVAVRAFGNNLFEVRSLVVKTELQNSGIGRKMVSFAMASKRTEYDSFNLFALTLVPDFFCKLGFKVVEKELFPEKIWSDCRSCPKFDCCDEIAVLYSYNKE